MTIKMNSGFLNGTPEGKMLMRVTVPVGTKKLDYGTLIFNPTGQKDRLPSDTNAVVILRGSFPAASWHEYVVGIVADADGLLLSDIQDVVVSGSTVAETGTCLISTKFSVESNNLVEHINWSLENASDSTALLPFKLGSATDGITLESLKGTMKFNYFLYTNTAHRNIL